MREGTDSTEADRAWSKKQSNIRQGAESKVADR